MLFIHTSKRLVVNNATTKAIDEPLLDVTSYRVIYVRG
jgi:hypothetical protein